MQAIAIRSELSAAAALACRIIPRRTSHAVLGNLALVERDGALVARASDLDREVTIRLGNSPADPGFAVTLPAHSLKDAEKKAPDSAEVDIRAFLSSEANTATTARLGFGKLNLSMVGLPFADYEEMGAPIEMSAPIYSDFTLSRADLLTMLNKVEFAISTEETRYYLNGIYMHATECGKLRFAATDGHRLALHEIDAPEGVSKNMPGVIIPRATVGTLRDLCKAKGVGDAFRVEVNTVKVRFTIGNVTLVTKLIDGTFPDYQRVIPQRNDKTLTMPVADAIEAIKAVSTVASDKGRAVRLAMRENAVTFSVNNPDTGTASQDVAAGWVHGEMDVGCNASYLLHILDRIDGDTVSFVMADSGSPMLIRDGATTFVQMPMRV